MDRGACALTASLLATEEGKPEPEAAARDCHRGEQRTGHAEMSSLAEPGSMGHRDQLLCMYENLTDHQAKQLLFYHGQEGSFLFVQQANSLTVHIRLGRQGRLSYSKHTILKNSEGYKLDESSTTYQSADELIQTLAHQYSALGVTLSPLFTPGDNSSSSPSTTFSVPPEYNAAQRHPNAPAKDLPTIRMLTRLHANVANTLRYPSPSSSGHFSLSSNYVIDHSPGCFQTCCHRLCHLDPEGRWWYPCKAGPAMCVLLTVVWMAVVLIFGWFVLPLVFIVATFLALVTVCAYLQTGECYCREMFCLDSLDQAETGAQ